MHIIHSFYPKVFIKYIRQRPDIQPNTIYLATQWHITQEIEISGLRLFAKALSIYLLYISLNVNQCIHKTSKTFSTIKRLITQKVANTR